jgi:hypothetical protein
MVMVLEVTPVVSPAVEPPLVVVAVVVAVDPLEAAVVELDDFDELPQAVATSPTASNPATPHRPTFWLRDNDVWLLAKRWLRFNLAPL